MTSSEQMAWNGEAAKGAYNYTDLNRVETAVSELASELGLSLTTKTNWTLWDIPVQTDMERYLENVAAIRDACPGEVEFPDLPDSMNNLSFEGANSIEKVLLLVYEELHGVVVDPDDPGGDDTGYSNVLGKFVLGKSVLGSDVSDNPDFPDTPVNPGDADYIRSGEIICGEVL
jgi:hypothetical protein